MMTIGSLLYGLAALAYGVLSILLLAAWRTRGSGWNIVTASLVTAVWAASLSFMSGHLQVPIGSMVVGDAVRYAAWIVALAYGANARGSVPGVAGIGLAASVAVAWLGVTHHFMDEPSASRWVQLIALLMPLSGLLLLAARYVEFDAHTRKGFAYLGFGFGMLMACDALLYAATLVVGGAVAETWLIRACVAGFAPLFIALAVSRRSLWPFRFALSRDVAFFMVSGTVVFTYCLLCLTLGQLIPRVVDGWGRAAQVVFYGAAAAPLILVVSSGSLRKWLRVLVTKHFFEHKYDYREEWLRFIATLSDLQVGEDPRRACLKAVAQIIGSPGALLAKRRDESREFECAAVWPGDEVAWAPAGDLLRAPLLLDQLGNRGWVVDLGEQSGRGQDEVDGPADPLRPGRGRWRLIVPVLFRDELDGAIFLEEPPGGLSITFEERDLLKTSARHVATHLAQFDAERRLAEARRFEVHSRLAAFTVHDLKNVAAQLQLVVSNAGRHGHKPEFIDDAVDTVANAARRIERLIGRLTNAKPGAPEAVATVGKIVTTAVQGTLDRQPNPTLSIETRDLAVGPGHEELGDIIEHLIRNAQDATLPDGRIEVSVRCREGTIEIAVVDTGHGMTSSFIRERLFRPFDTTKDGRGMGLGAYQARVFARSMGGEVEVESEPGSGTTIRLMLPAARLAAAA